MAIQTVALSFESLAQLDNGQMQKLLDLHLFRASQDCQNRPSLPDKRVITLSLTLVPVVDSMGDCSRVDVVIGAKTKLPDYRSAPYQMQPTSKGLAFNHDFPQTLDQQPLFNEGDED